MAEKIKILGVVGSLRKDSFNMALLKAAQELAPKGVVIELADISKFPFYNPDNDGQKPPADVQKFKAQIKEADAILFAVAEYNHSMSGVMKNAIDWASRPTGDNSWDGKSAAVMSASSGMLGGVRAQIALKQTFVYLNIFALNQPEVYIGTAQDKIKDGRVVDEKTRSKIKELVAAFAAFSGKFR